MPFQDLDPPESRLHCDLVAYSPVCAALADDLISCWPNSRTPAALELDGAVLPQWLHSHAVQGWVLLLTAEAADAPVLDFNRWLVARHARTLIVLARPDSLWALRRDDARVSPCVACLCSQGEFLPRHAATPSPSTRDSAQSLSHWIGEQMAENQGGEHCALHPVLAGPDARTCQILQDPLCPGCSMHAVRPNHVYFTADS
ncbi:hypothetical protein F2P44_08825 [Massilia sp. CCM 8695]|uniref:Uncharacterized protein n=1 Tax=Massilia frigida TaxID=2609281 RepID=A0ABX0N4M3_9BURK|nr:hypothetical protein [Massilia frigida]NHZ79378.1 hypothetical protein [Massilia frigida]